MRVQPDPRLPQSVEPAFRARFYELWRELSNIINVVGMWSGEGTAAPTTGTWAQGDTYRNTAPAEAGAVSSKYVVVGWICTVSGTPGTWLEMRCLTGN